MRGTRLAVWAVLGLSPVLAADTLDLGTVQGRYSYTFENGTVDGGRFMSENDLDIVKLTANKAFFRTALEFFNGHQCLLYGVAAVEGNALVYRKDEVLEGATPDHKDLNIHCEFRIVFGPQTVAFRDVNNDCRTISCGARGGYEGVAFPRASREPFADRDALRQFPEFKEALEDAGMKP